MVINQDEMKNIINNVIIKSTPTPEQKKIETFAEDKSEDSTGSYIADSSNDISNSNGGISLNEEDIQTIANNLYTKMKNSTSMITSSSFKEDYDSSDESNNTSIIGTLGKGLSTFSRWLDIGYNAYDNALEQADYWTDWAGKIIHTLGSYVSSDSNFSRFLKSLFEIIGNSAVDYNDGVSETSFGAKMEESWSRSGSTVSFLDYFKKTTQNIAQASKTIKFLNSTPLDSGPTRSSLFGTMILGTPYLFNNYADPTNRTMINTFLKDGRYVSLTPGLPKYNGTSYYGTKGSTQLNQTESPSAMLNYLTRNGLGKTFNETDKRYYTFKPSYEEYFSYLETMLNALWIKMGLANNGSNTFNLFTFFQIKTDNGSIDPSQYDNLYSQYKSSIGFYANTAAVASESIDNNTSSFGLDSIANQNREEYLTMNYITGMGTGTNMQSLSRKIGISQLNIHNMKAVINDNSNYTRDAIDDKDSKGLRKLTKVISSAALDIATFTNQKDLGSILQSFTTTNGMSIKYPELWEDSSYAKNINLNFTFTSPYGDPLSIFKYVYVPFCALLCFSMPRQAAENGLVSPFLVRADIPGVITSDLALISSMTWTKGGNSALWTKDGLPRSIDVSITLTDLYPYLAMTKRLSYLSANPSYTVFLDNMTGMMSLNDDSSDPINGYFKEMLDRVTDNNNRDILWNRYTKYKQETNKSVAEKQRDPIGYAVDMNSIPWMYNASV